MEFREGARTQGSGLTAGVCRFCGASGSSGLLSIGNVCADYDCQVYLKISSIFQAISVNRIIVGIDIRSALILQ